MKEMKEVVLEKFNEALEQIDIDKQYDSIADEQFLLESGLDSLGFARCSRCCKYIAISTVYLLSNTF